MSNDEISECFTSLIPNPSDPGLDSASKRNEYQEYFLGIKEAGA